MRMAVLAAVAGLAILAGCAAPETGPAATEPTRMTTEREAPKAEPAPEAPKAEPAPAPETPKAAPTEKTAVVEAPKPAEPIETQPIPPIATGKVPTPPKAEPAEAKEPATTAEPTRERMEEVATKSEAAVLVLDRFGSAKRWTVQSWANEGTVASEKRGAGHRLVVALGGGEHDKTALARTVTVDLSNRRHLLLDVRNVGEKPVQVAVALSVVERKGVAAKYYETEPVTVKPGEEKAVSYGLKTASFKTAPNWTSFASRIQDLSEVTQIALLFYGPEGAKVELGELRATTQ
jgi:hypothetical protein